MGVRGGGGEAAQAVRLRQRRRGSDKVGGGLVFLVRLRLHLPEGAAPLGRRGQVLLQLGGRRGGRGGGGLLLDEGAEEASLAVSHESAHVLSVVQEAARFVSRLLLPGQSGRAARPAVTPKQTGSPA